MTWGGQYKARRKLRIAHLECQDSKCAYCRSNIVEGLKRTKTNGHVTATLEHLIPVSYFGPSTDLNTLAICFQCNTRRQNRLPSVKQIIRIIMAKKSKSIQLLTFVYQHMVLYHYSKRLVEMNN